MPRGPARSGTHCAKRGIMSDDVQREIQKAVELTERSRATFEKAHQEGTEALRCHDRTALTRAITTESEAIAQHKEAVHQLGRVIHKTLNDRRSR